MIKTTYLIEYNKSVIGYFYRLKDAKSELEAYNDPKYRILCLKGQRFGEGRHAYEIVYHRGDFPGGVFLKTNLG